jgi:hypothetical protein
MKERLVDPVHFFDAKGNSMLSYNLLVERNRILESQNQRLTALLRKQIERNKAYQAAASTTTTH